MDRKQPSVSVVLAVHNGEKFIAETLDSIAGQTFRDWECIIIEDFSDDGTPGILKEYAASDPRFRVYPNEVNLRLAKSLNRGIGLASGKYIIRMDADDICLPDRFERQVAFMEQNPDLSVSYCKFFTLCEGEVRLAACGRRCEREAVSAMFLFFNPVLHPGSITRSEVMKKYGYRPEYTCSEDMDLWERMLMGGEKIACQNEYLMLYRIHASQITATTNEKQRTEIMDLQKRFYGKMLFEPTEEELRFYISHIYFRDSADLKGLYAFYRRIMKSNRAKKSFEPAQITNAFMEILAECKRNFPMSTAEKASLLKFGGVRFVSEWLKRKKRVKRDIGNAAEAAIRAGCEQKRSDALLPVFLYHGGKEKNEH